VAGLQMTTVVVLDGNSYARCPKCERLVPFFRGEQGALHSDIKRFASDALVAMECRIHGSFDVPAGKFHNKCEPDK
jgi:hypothetical protein